MNRKLQEYVQQFNADDDELYANAFANDEALDFLADNIPLFECPDEDFERTYYFRWWTFRKHLKQTPDGWVMTEFLPGVPWSGKHNTIVCPAGHHFYEGRWLGDPRYLDDYAVFWFRGGGDPRLYSSWLADAIFARHLVVPNRAMLVELLDDLVSNFRAWEASNRDGDGLFHQIDDRDGGEVSIGGHGYRPTINSYMFGEAQAITKIADLAGRQDLAATFAQQAERLRGLVLAELWDDQARFFKVRHRAKRTLADVCELHGYTPWYFNLPEPGKGYEAAWKQLTDPQGFCAPFGPTTAEQRHPGFTVSYQGHECQWNGPSWPYATSVTLTALANLLNGPEQDAVSKADYFQTLSTYTSSHRLQRADGKVVPWIDENLNPRTGDWIARTRLKQWRDGDWDPAKGGKERGKDYNHSTYCDLIITGLVGLRPRDDDVVEVHPLLPDDIWDYFQLDNVSYHGRTLTIRWDATGERYCAGQGLAVLADGRMIARSDRLARIAGKL
jgi:hypothetical protein